jgi:hypothetical protein
METKKSQIEPRIEATFTRTTMALTANKQTKAAKTKSDGGNQSKRSYEGFLSFHFI